MKKFFLFSAIVLMTTLVGCSNDSENEPLSFGGGDKPQPEWTKSDNFVLAQLAMASNTLGCTLTDIMVFENDGWTVDERFKYVHLEKTIYNVNIVMECHMSGDTIFHTICGLSPVCEGTVLANLSYVKDAVATLTSQLVLTTLDSCDFRLMRFKEVLADSYQNVTSFDEALAAIGQDNYFYTFVWDDMVSTDCDSLSDDTLSGTASGLNLGFIKYPNNDCFVSMEVTSSKYK